MRAVCASLVFSLTLAAQAQSNEDMLSLPAPTLSETEEAQPDWFQQFTFNQHTDILPLRDESSKTLKLAWVKGERWNLSVDLTSRGDNSALAREEMSAEANFLITPRISVGGELSIGADELDDAGQWQEQEIEAGIRLRSAFKF